MPNKKSSKTIGIVIPVFNDWESLDRVIQKLEERAASLDFSFHIFVVDDGSSEPLDLTRLPRTAVSELQLIRLTSNLGHQRAIAVGLVAASLIEKIEAVIVMDGDGQDRPEDVPRLIAAWGEDPRRIVVAQRIKRPEGLMFRFLYGIYKIIFRTLTGKKIDFGNFCLLPRGPLRALTYNPSIWNNLAAAITRSNISRIAVPVGRGARAVGESRMNFESLVIHGVSAMAVYSDVVLLRILLGACTLGGLAGLATVGVVAVRLAIPDWTIPGWASYLGAALIIIVLQALVMSAIALFQLISFRNIKAFIPAVDAASFVNCDKRSSPAEKNVERMA